MDEPYYSNVQEIPDHDWEHSVYGKYEEDVTEDAPDLLGKRIIFTHYFDTSPMHDILSGKAVTGVYTFYNKTPVNWYYKQQSTSEIATYGAEFLSERKVCENIIDHRAYLQYLRKPIGHRAYLQYLKKSVGDMDYV